MEGILLHSTPNYTTQVYLLCVLLLHFLQKLFSLDVDNPFLLEILDPAGSTVLFKLRFLLAALVFDLLLVLWIQCVYNVYLIQAAKKKISAFPTLLPRRSRRCLGRIIHRFSLVEPTHCCKVVVWARQVGLTVILFLLLAFCLFLSPFFARISATLDVTLYLTGYGREWWTFFEGGERGYPTWDRIIWPPKRHVEYCKRRLEFCSQIQHFFAVSNPTKLVLKRRGDQLINEIFNMIVHRRKDIISSSSSSSFFRFSRPTGSCL